MRAFLTGVTILILVGFRPPTAQALTLDMDTVVTEARGYVDEFGIIVIGIVVVALVAKLVTDAWRQARTGSGTRAKSSDRRPVNCDHLFQKKVLQPNKST